MNELILTALVPTDAVTLGFLPAARRLGLQAVVLTSHPEEHLAQYAGWGDASPEVVACPVQDPFAVIAEVARRSRPAAIFSNSDHLQAQTALAAQYFGLPAKDWQAAYRVKNKAGMRAHLAQAGVDTVWFSVLSSADDLDHLEAAPFPCVLKPREGIASEDVILVPDHAALRQTCAAFWARQPRRALILEEYLQGPLHTLETLGDHERVQVLGSFATALGAPPHFIETQLDWHPLAPEVQAQVMAQLSALGVGFGACHTEFVLTPQGPRLIEVNYRNIGDQCDLMLQDLLELPLFEWVLRAHLGERLPDLPAPRHTATVRYFCTRQAGTLVQSPEARQERRGEVALTYRPLRRPGEQVPLSHTNRDYLGVLRAVGPLGAPLEAAVAAFSADLHWEVRP
ncbi:ATP-grasp domain-containing protein [Deinococcus hohokamensis]|uniref:Acetyl-CoA carboxylase biotin carboxylase subunit family protein n=1 Tax=Deinococcus hohokamensis TaxID=309883 RepID=A0ABV9IBC3_9DEIO